ncbi:SDR family NAD(P)-dependent oxidoreductase [Paenibacillus sp. MSJ-34]|uniref:SDR family NAD(P)-dependent oxidoreductase n=1 Tax=Paenibacillus sp. MSJ-34 TaxID=2841529 RepID=UPI001C1029FA|nr:SDR family oxidoreductase [Paenibacillus sp. MSJ-34]MBU5443622.1 SDR family oxidoreductase [Paenibacillus sp. MSJ-34]
MSVFAKDALSGKHGIVTGASGEIGEAIVREAVLMGAAVTVTGRNADKLERLRRSVIREAPEAAVHIIPADLSKQAGRDLLVAEAERWGGPPSFLVNNAGIYEAGTMEELDEEQLTRVMHLNYTVSVLLAQKVYESMKTRKEGAIVNVSSLSGLRGSYGNTAYAASKFALIGFTHCMALEAIKHGIRVNAVCPGFVETEMGYSVIRKQSEYTGESLEEQIRRTKEGIPSGRITTPAEAARTVAFLLTEAAGNIVGEAVKISGGALLR